jgi:hypothetical protein
MRVLRPFTTITVRTTDGRYRHAVVTGVANQNQVTARIGLGTSKRTVTANRTTSTTTRGKEWVQA